MLKVGEAYEKGYSEEELASKIVDLAIENALTRGMTAQMTCVVGYAFCKA